MNRIETAEGTDETAAEKRADSAAPLIGSWSYDAATQRAHWSGEMYRIYGVEESFDLSEYELIELIHPADRDLIISAYRAAYEQRIPFVGEYRVTPPDRPSRKVLVRGGFVPGPDGAGQLVGTAELVATEGIDQQHLMMLANHDPLTGLLNRRSFLDELERIGSPTSVTSPGAILMIDLDRFKDINDSLGHVEGDALLRRVALLLQSRLRASDRLARLGGDEFAIILPDCPSDVASQMAEDLVELLRSGTEVVLAGRPRELTASIGIATFGGPASQRTGEELLVEADLAMYRGKGQGGGVVELFGEEMRSELRTRVEVEAELRHALGREELLLHYQPLVSVEDQGVVCCEALLRWQHPRRGLVPPGEFIPHAEATGLINPIGAWVIEEACRQTQSWRQSGANITISVNVSPRQLIEQNVQAVIESALAHTGLPPAALMIEVTETSLLDGPDRLRPVLSAIKELGVRLAVDDFGRGSSSLSFLRVLPVDVVKIDRMFIAGLPDSGEDRAIVAAVLSLADEIGLTVVAEGVESERQHWELNEMGCPLAQGFLYSRPRPVDDLELSGFTHRVNPGVGDPSVIREFMRQIGIPARIEA